MIGPGGLLLVVSHLFDAVSEEQWQLASSFTHDDGGWRHCVLCECYGVTTGLYPIIMCGFGCCWTNNVRTSSVGSLQKGSLQNSKNVHNTGHYQTNIGVVSLDPIHEVLLAFRSEVLSSRVDTSVHVHTKRWVCLPRSSCCLEWTDFWKKRAMMVVDTLRVLQKKKTSYNVSEGRCLPLWMCIEEIEEDLHNQCICSKTKKESIGFM